MMQQPLKPWERIAWKPETEQIIYRDWGLYYTRKQQVDIAAKYYDKSLDLRGDDHKALFYRSKCKRDIAQTAGALVDSTKALQLNVGSAPVNLEICDALYELSRFEECKIRLHDNSRVFEGNKVAAFHNRMTVIDENFGDTIGKTLSPFILKNEKHFPQVLAEIERKQYVDPRPLWKILRDQERCDVLSIMEREEEFLSPREIARRERAFKVFNQIYFNKSWIDVLFIKELRDDPNLMLEQSKVSTPNMRFLTCTKYEIMRRFLKMLQARSPLYTERLRKCPNRRIAEEHRQSHLFRIQYQTRRNMLTILRTVRHLRGLNKVSRLAEYVESVMGDYVVLKTYRVMPWKFEFMNEVYNTLALAYLDRYMVPEDILQSREKDRLLIMLRMPRDKYRERNVQFVFGDKSTYQEPDAPDYALMAYKKFLNRLEKRMRFAYFPIERTYLLHEIARAHLGQSRFDECCSVARKAMDEGKVANVHTWRFLSVMLICKAHAVLHKIERAKDALDDAYQVAEDLKSAHLCDFIDTCRAINDEDISMKKRSQSMDSMRKRRSKLSMGSRNSNLSEHSTEEYM